MLLKTSLQKVQVGENVKKLKSYIFCCPLIANQRIWSSDVMFFLRIALTASLCPTFEPMHMFPHPHYRLSSSVILTTRDWSQHCSLDPKTEAKTQPRALGLNRIKGPVPLTSHCSVHVSKAAHLIRTRADTPGNYIMLSKSKVGSGPYIIKSVHFPYVYNAFFLMIILEILTAIVIIAKFLLNTFYLIFLLQKKRTIRRENSF